MQINLYNINSGSFPYCPHCDSLIVLLNVSNHSTFKEDGLNSKAGTLSIYSCPNCNKIIGIGN